MILDRVRILVTVVLNLLILVALLLFAAQFVTYEGIQTSWLAVQLHRFGDPIVAVVAGWLPSSAKRYAPLLLAAIFYVVRVLLDRAFVTARRASVRLETAPVPASEVDSATAGVESEEARSQLYAEYRQIEKALNEAKRRQCTFLSVDLAGSAAMKAGQTDVAITSTFRAYEDFLRRIFKKTHAWKQSWTPDGTMVCFLNLSEAIAAAQTILRELPAFNQRQNRLQTNLEARCGINEGEIVIFEDSAIEKLVEHTIDVAGHMQKRAQPGTLLLSKDVYDALEDRSGFLAAEAIVDERPTYVWSPQANGA